MASEELSAEFISQKDNLVEIYRLIFNAAVNTLQPEETDGKQLVEFNVPEKNRFSKNIRNNATKDIKISYNPDNICITGGSALNAYDLILEEYRKRKATTPLKEFVNRSTSDIDIVWWPTVRGADSTKYAVISASPIIHNFVIRLEKQLEESFAKLIGKQYTILNKSYTINEIHINNNFTPVGPRPAGYLYGTHQLKISIKMNDKWAHIVDFSIYDTASGQTKTSQPLVPMNKDPVYMNQENIKRLEINVNVPEIKHLIRQQIFAFGNILPLDQVKAMVIYKRILYIKELINKADSRNNIRNITRVFGDIGNIPIKTITDTLNKNSINSLQNVNAMIEDEIKKTETNNIENYNNIIQRLKELDIEYSKERLAIEAPIREAKRRGQNTKKVKDSIASQLKKLDDTYNDKKKELINIKNTLEATLPPSHNIKTPILPTPQNYKTPILSPLQNARTLMQPTQQNVRTSIPTRQPIMTRPPLPPQIIEEYRNDAGQLIGLVYDERYGEFESIIEILPNGKRIIRTDLPILKLMNRYQDARGFFNDIFYNPATKMYIHRIRDPYLGKMVDYIITHQQYTQLIGHYSR